MIGAPNSLNLNCKVRVMKEAPGPSVWEEIADIFTNYNIDGLTSIPAWTSNNIPYKVRDKITYPFPNLNGCTVHLTL